MDEKKETELEEQIEQKEEQVEQKQEITKVTVAHFSELTETEKEDLETKYKKMRKRIFNIMQYEKHPQTNEILITEEKIKEALSEFKKCNYAYILHNKDLKENTTEKKPNHFHIVLQLENPISLITVAKRFDLMPNFIECPKGRNSFADCCEYLTHEHPEQQQKGKHLYDDEEVKANFDFRELIEETLKIRMNNELKTKMSRKAYYFNKVHKGEMRLNDVLVEDIDFYYENEKNLKYFRGAYLQENAEMPCFRQNYYIFGEGGAGKDVMSRALARSLFPKLEDDSEIFFEVGGNGVLFDGYDGQPVLIWSDYRAIELLRAFNYNRGMLFKIFDTHPPRVNLNVKYSRVNLINEYNIVNSVEDYKEFLDGLAGEYTSVDGIEHSAEDKKQSYRRFPMIIPVRTEDFDVMINKGFLGEKNENSYFEYEKIKNVIGNFKKIVKIKDNKMKREIEQKTLKCVNEKCEQLKLLNQENEILNEKEFENYGRTFDEVEEEYPW